MSGNQQGILKIEIGSATKFGNHEIERGQDAHVEIGLIDEGDGAVAVAGRHRHNRPAGKVLRLVRRNLLRSQKLQQRRKGTVEFTLHIARRTV